MNSLAAAVFAAGELICEFSDGYRKSLLAAIAGESPKLEQLLIYEAITPESAQVLVSRRTGRKPVIVRTDDDHVHFIERDGPSVRVTTLTACTRTKPKDGVEQCTRFDARHAWHFDTTAHLDPATSLARQPSGAATGACEPWKID